MESMSTKKNNEIEAFRTSIAICINVYDTFLCRWKISFHIKKNIY